MANIDQDNKYFMINVLSHRARSLNRGDRPVVPYQEGATDSMHTAMDEYRAGKLRAEIVTLNVKK